MCLGGPLRKRSFNSQLGYRTWRLRDGWLYGSFYNSRRWHTFQYSDKVPGLRKHRYWRQTPAHNGHGLYALKKPDCGKHYYGWGKGIGSRPYGTVLLYGHGYSDDFMMAAETAVIQQVTVQGSTVLDRHQLLTRYPLVEFRWKDPLNV